MKRIAVIPNNSKDIGLVNTKRLVEFLNGKAEIYIDEAYSVLGLNVNYVAESEILDNAEYLIVLGGDGTILQRAAECAKRKIPVLGINLGKIGFMTEIEIDDMEDAISKFLQDDFTIEKRMMMKAEIRKENKKTPKTKSNFRFMHSMTLWCRKWRAKNLSIWNFRLTV